MLTELHTDNMSQSQCGKHCLYCIPSPVGSWLSAARNSAVFVFQQLFWLLTAFRLVDSVVPHPSLGLSSTECYTSHFRLTKCEQLKGSCNVATVYSLQTGLGSFSLNSSPHTIRWALPWLVAKKCHSATIPKSS